MSFKKVSQLISIVIILTAFITSNLHADRGVGDFLQRGIGARALGMGGAYVALVDDSTSIYWNPAALSMMKNKRELASMYCDRFNLGIKYHYLSYGERFKNYGFGIGLINLSINDIPKITERDVFGRIIIGKETFKNSENALLVSFSKRLGKDIFIGATVKSIYQHLDKYKAKGYGFDIGMIFKIDKDLTFGLNYQDIGITKIKWNTKSNYEGKIFPHLKAGFCLKLLKERLILAVDIDNPKYKDNLVHLGIEFKLKNYLYLRCGAGQYNREDKAKDCYSAGATIYIDNLSLDYAYNTHTLGDTHLFSLSLGFGGK